MGLSFIIVDNRSWERVICRTLKRLILVDGKVSVLLDFSSRCREKFSLLMMKLKLKY